jgi:DNA-binding HxlR family transcriptional regulator
MCEVARKSYGQFCAVARTLDHVGDRWSMLVLRELLLSESTYGELLGALPGIPTNLLSARLRDLEADGLVDRHADHADRRRVRYSLTPSGRDIEPVLLAMIRWGARWMMSGPEDDEFDPRWIELALRALLTDSHMAGGERVLVDVLDASPLLITGRSDGRAEVGENDSGGEHDAVITGHASNLLALFSGSWTLSRARRAGVRTRGSRRTLAILLSHEQPSPAA